MENDVTTLTPTERSDWNGLVSHADNIGSSVVDPNIINSYKGVNPNTTLTPDHIPVALNEIDSLKSGNPIPGIPAPAASYLKSGMSDAYVFNPYNINYPVSATHGTNLENHIGESIAADPNKIQLQDTRKVALATGAKIQPGQTNGTYDTAIINNVIAAAKHVGVDPNTALAVALQESHMGVKNPENLGNVYAGYGKAPDGLNQQAYELAKTLRDKMDEGKRLGFKDEAHQLQMYNGMGKLKVGMMNGKPTPTKYYGIDVTKDQPLDLKKNPLYGKTIQDLRENVIKKNPRIQKLISGQ